MWRRPSGPLPSQVVNELNQAGTPLQQRVPLSGHVTDNSRPRIRDPCSHAKKRGTPCIKARVFLPQFSQSYGAALKKPFSESHSRLAPALGIRYQTSTLETPPRRALSRPNQGGLGLSKHAACQCHGINSAYQRSAGSSLRSNLISRIPPSVAIKVGFPNIHVTFFRAAGFNTPSLTYFHFLHCIHIHIS